MLTCSSNKALAVCLKCMTAAEQIRARTEVIVRTRRDRSSVRARRTTSAQPANVSNLLSIEHIRYPGHSNWHNACRWTARIGPAHGTSMYLFRQIEITVVYVLVQRRSQRERVFNECRKRHKLIHLSISVFELICGERARNSALLGDRVCVIWGKLVTSNSGTIIIYHLQYVYQRQMGNLPDMTLQLDSYPCLSIYYAIGSIYLLWFYQGSIRARRNRVGMKECAWPLETPSTVPAKTPTEALLVNVRSAIMTRILRFGD